MHSGKKIGYLRLQGVTGYRYANGMAGRRPVERLRLVRNMRTASGTLVGVALTLYALNRSAHIIHLGRGMMSQFDSSEVSFNAPQHDATKMQLFGIVVACLDFLEMFEQYMCRGQGMPGWSFSTLVSEPGTTIRRRTNDILRWLEQTSRTILRCSI